MNHDRRGKTAWQCIMQFTISRRIAAALSCYSNCRVPRIDASDPHFFGDRGAHDAATRGFRRATLASTRVLWLVCRARAALTHRHYNDVPRAIIRCYR